MRGWEEAGLIPFTRKPLALLLKEQEQKVTLLDKFTAERGGGPADLGSFYCNGKNVRGDFDPAAAVDPLSLGRVSTQGKFAVKGPITDDEGYAEVKAKTLEKRERDDDTAANKALAEDTKRLKVIASGPVAAQALAELTTKHGGELMKLNKDQLSALCISRGLNAGGNKSDLAERLGTPSLLALMPPPSPPLPPPPPLPLPPPTGHAEDKSDDENADAILGPE
jgi:hypothetical protein